MYPADELTALLDVFKAVRREADRWGTFQEAGGDDIAGDDVVCSVVLGELDSVTVYTGGFGVMFAGDKYRVWISLHDVVLKDVIYDLTMAAESQLK
jgi:hypothetical protein